MHRWMRCTAGLALGSLLAGCCTYPEREGRSGTPGGPTLALLEGPGSDLSVGSTVRYRFAVTPRPEVDACVEFVLDDVPGWLPAPTYLGDGAYIVETVAPPGSSANGLDATYAVRNEAGYSEPLTVRAPIRPISWSIHPVPGSFGKEGSGNRSLTIEIPAGVFPDSNPTMTPIYKIWVDTSLLGPGPQGFITDAFFWDPQRPQDGSKHQIGQNRETQVKVQDPGEYTFYTGAAAYEALRNAGSVWIKLRPQRTQEVYIIHSAQVIVE